VAGTLSTSGSLVYTITGTPSAGGTATFALNFGGQAFTLTRLVLPIGTIAPISDAVVVQNGNLTIGVAASGVSSVIPYTGGNAGFHDGQTLTSTGVTGLTATLIAGNFADGNGSLTYTITGTPASAGTASFAINIGGQTRPLTRTVSSFVCGTSTVPFVYNTLPVTYGTVVGAGGKCWLDRNLGATRVASSSTDAASYGDLYQWGRSADGHQIRNSQPTTTTKLLNYDSTSSSFVKVSSGDWWNGSNNNLWQVVSGINNPCPSGYRIPTSSEFQVEINNWGYDKNSIGANNSPLKLPMAGYRMGFDAGVREETTAGRYWSSTTSSSTTSYNLSFSSSTASSGAFTDRVDGYSVRCIKD
jgi:uncharacterized protein (TIGR02145 family)